METWKKALVAIAIVAIFGGLWATQFTRVRVQVNLHISGEYSDVQLVAYDAGVDTTYLLSNDSSVLKLDLGTLAWHYQRTWTAAFGIVWAKSSGSSLKISAIKIFDSSGHEVNNYPVKIALHKDPTKTCWPGWGGDTEDSYYLYYDGTSGGSVDPPEYVVLEPVSGSGYSGTTLTYGTSDGTDTTPYTAAWTTPSGEGPIWVDNHASDPATYTDVPIATNLQDTSNYDTTAGGANFVWVEITVEPNDITQHGDFSGYYIYIMVENV